MASFSLRLPESLKERVRRVAEREGISMNQFVTLAVAEKTALAESGLDQKQYLQARIARTSDDPRKALLALLDQAGDEEPRPEDRLP